VISNQESKTMAINESILNDLHKQATAAAARPVIKWVDIDPRTLLAVLELAYRAMRDDSVAGCGGGCSTN